MKKGIILFLIILLVILSPCCKGPKYVAENKVSNVYDVKDTISKGYVPDEETAKRIAEAIWLPIYGEKILEQRPYDAQLIGDVWVVKGLIPLPYRYDSNYRGGSAYIEIQKKDCKILKVTHSR
ncbi:MAG: YbbC/YhhH family protein [Candidatus Symbiothrix sp.]|jgi:hypothetical protein|nr:YbbC/YhhH family protein [Candidatus Symbiothrix sp.]